MSRQPRIERPRGTHDVTPAEQPAWRRVTSEIERLCALYGYRPITTPVFEDTALFERTSGAGSDVVQIYVRDVESSVHRPDKELKGFAKVHLAPGESADVAVALDRRSFAVWDVAAHDWLVERGDFEIVVARSSVDVVATLTHHVDSDDEVASAPSPRVKRTPRASANGVIAVSTSSANVSSVSHSRPSVCWPASARASVSNSLNSALRRVMSSRMLASARRYSSVGRGRSSSTST